MADLSIEFAGIKSPNPFWLASAPPANSGDQVMRAFDHGWGGLSVADTVLATPKDARILSRSARGLIVLD